jgi:hypothetical protein
MSETTLRTLTVDELTALRIVCEKCGAVLEVPIDRLNGGGAIQGLTCPAGCGAEYRIPSTCRSDVFAKFADVIRDLKQLTGCRVEIVLPARQGN